MGCINNEQLKSRRWKMNAVDAIKISSSGFVFMIFLYQVGQMSI